MKCEAPSGWACQVHGAPWRGLTIQSRFFFFHLDPSCLTNYLLFLSYSPIHACTSETVPLLESFLCEVKAAAILEFSTNQTPVNFSHLVHEGMEGGVGGRIQSREERRLREQKI